MAPRRRERSAERGVSNFWTDSRKTRRWLPLRGSMSAAEGVNDWGRLVCA